MQALGRPKKAKEWLDKALTTEPNQVSALVALAEVAMQSDEYHQRKRWGFIEGPPSLIRPTSGYRSEKRGPLSNWRSTTGFPYSRRSAKADWFTSRIDGNGN